MTWDGRDKLDELFADVARSGSHRTDGDGAHLTPEQIHGLLARKLAPAARERVFEHIAGCDVCVERLVAAKAVGDVDAIGGASLRSLPVDLGPSIFDALGCGASRFVGRARVQRGGSGRAGCTTSAWRRGARRRSATTNPTRT